jgi:hypothetical protein
VNGKDGRTTDKLQSDLEQVESVVTSGGASIVATVVSTFTYPDNDFPNYFTTGWFCQSKQDQDHVGERSTGANLRNCTRQKRKVLNRGT